MNIEEKKPTQRTLNALETKERVYRTALELFTAHGYDNVTVDEITSAAGVAKGTFYSYFETKEAVLLEQYQQITQYYQEVFPKIPAGLPASERLLAFIDAIMYYDAEIRGVEIMRIVYASQISTKPVIRFIGDKSRLIYVYLREILASGKASGEFCFDITEDELVEVMMRNIWGTVYDWCVADGELDLRAEGRRHFSFLLSCLKREPPQA